MVAMWRVGVVCRAAYHCNGDVDDQADDLQHAQHVEDCARWAVGIGTGCMGNSWLKETKPRA